jgi:hypothetical protein
VPTPNEFIFNTIVDDDLYDDLNQLVGETIVHAAVWEDSMADALSDRGGGPRSEPAIAEEAASFDLDLYLAGGVYFELYGVTLYDDPEGEPVLGAASAESRLLDLARAGATLGEVAVDDEDSLVLVLTLGGSAALYLDIGGFVVEEWDELPV